MPDNTSERALLSSIIQQGIKGLVLAATQGITKEHFFDKSCKCLFQIIQELSKKNQEIDDLNIWIEIEQRKLNNIVDNRFFLDTCNICDTSIGIQKFIDAVIENYKKEKILILTKKVNHSINNGGTSNESINEMQKNILEINKKYEQRKLLNGQRLKRKLEEELNSYFKREPKNCIKSGFDSIDKIIDGFKNGQMIVIAGRPSMGKSALASNIATNMCSYDPSKSIVIFSMEMTATELGIRMATGMAKISANKIKQGILLPNEKEKLDKAVNYISHSNIYIDDNLNQTIFDIRTKCMLLKHQNQLGAVFIDYLQLVKTDTKIPREQAIAEISRQCKTIAKDLEVPVIALCQLNRELEREKRQPRVSDLRESGSMEQDADIVILIGKDLDTPEEEQMAMTIIERHIIVAKNRNGRIGTATMQFHKSSTSFKDIKTINQNESLLQY